MSRAPSPVTGRRLVDLRPALQGWADPVAWGIGWDGAVYAAARRSAEALTMERGIGIFPKSTLDAPTEYLVVRSTPDRVQTVVHRAESLVVSFVQPFGGGVLLAGARCHWRAEGTEQNAVAIDWNGRELGRYTLGDGIQDLRVTRDGTLWVSYFDEGVFGNFGWSSPGPAPIGAAGLVAFSPDGNPTIAYDAAAARTDSICDAYGMNVTEDGDVWVYFYTEFPVVRIRRGEYRSWNPRVSGAHALAVRSDSVLLLGDYEHPSLGRVLQLGEAGHAATVRKVAVKDPAGESLDCALAMGFGEKLAWLQDREVMVIDEW